MSADMRGEHCDSCGAELEDGQVGKCGDCIDAEAPALSHGAAYVLNLTLDAMQNADEMGGHNGNDDYVALMNSIIKEATERRDAAIANAGAA